MKSRLFKTKNFIALGKIMVISLVVIIGLLLILKSNSTVKTEALEIKSVATMLEADGVVTPENQAILHFQTGGKLVYLPFKVGDKVYQGQMIAQLDIANLSANLRQAEQSFVAAQAVSQKYYDGRDPNAAESYDDKIKRTAIDAAQNVAYDNVVKARQAIADASLISPINGVITQEDVTLTNVNVTPATGFTVSDPFTLVFRANILENDIDFVSAGNPATVMLGDNNISSISGIISKIYPDKVTLPTGQRVFQVDVESNVANKFGQISQSGTALIQSDSSENIKLVPTWTVLNHDSIWVLTGNKSVLRSVIVGKTHGNMTEILNGLNADDKVIVNPESVAAVKYKII